jgi:shikimate 5-dehydrogenase
MAYLAALTRLRKNVAVEVAAVRLVGTGPAAEAALVRLMEHLDADIREVRRDVELIIERHGVGW